MKIPNMLIIVLLSALATASIAQESIARSVFQTDLPDIEGREALVLEVVYPPGVQSTRHRHNAHTIVYVLEGAVQMQVAGGELKTLTAGQTFYETPGDIHAVSRNASETEPATVLVFLIKKQDAPVSVPADE